jgi:hypothetical protein
MRFFHRTSLSPDEVLAQAEEHFAPLGTVTDSGGGTRTITGAVGTISLEVHREGGHYTRVSIQTDQPCQGEADKLAKGFLTAVHQKVHTSHIARGTH